MIQWHDVNSGIPMESVDEVLVCLEFLETKKQEIVIMHLSEHTPKIMFSGFEPLGDKRGFRKITHWAYIPEPPREINAII